MPATTAATIELADVFRVAGPAYRAEQAGHLSLDTLKVMAAIERCRTASLGGHVGCSAMGFLAHPPLSGLRKLTPLLGCLLAGMTRRRRHGQSGCRGLDGVV